MIAKEGNLITATRKDSTGICFIGKRNFQEFLGTTHLILNEYICGLKVILYYVSLLSYPPYLGDYIDTKPGSIYHVANPQTKLGRHEGVRMYTIGQKIRLGGMKDTYV